MKVIRFIWWVGGPLFGIICLGYAIAFAGWGLSFWATKPEPDAFLSTMAFLTAFVCAIDRAIEEVEEGYLG